MYFQSTVYSFSFENPNVSLCSRLLGKMIYVFTNLYEGVSDC